MSGATRRQPTGFVARCQCGVITGALDVERTHPKDLGVLLGKWLMQGCTVEPRFEGSWSAPVGACQCDDGDWRRYVHGVMNKHLGMQAARDAGYKWVRARLRRDGWEIQVRDSPPPLTEGESEDTP